MARVSDLSKAIRDFKSKAIDKENLSRDRVNDIVRKTILDTVKSMFNTNTDRRFKELFENFDSIQNDLKITDDSYRMNIFVSKDFPIEIDVSTEALNNLAENDYYKKVNAMQEIMMDIVSCTQEFYEKITNQNYVYTKNDKSLNETYKSSCLEIGKDFALQIGNGEDKLNAQKRNCNRIANKVVTIEMLRAFKDDNVAKSDIFERACRIVDEIDSEEISEYNVDGKVYRVSNEEEVIAKNPELLEKYNVLRYGYNDDGSRKSVLEILDYSLDQKKSLTDEENINQVNEITAIRVLSELQMSTNPDAEIAQLVNKYGREEALKMLNDVNFTISLLNNQQDLKRKIGNEVTEKYKEALKDVEYLDENGNVVKGRFDNEKEKYLDFISEGDYEKVYANININIIGDKGKDTQEPTQVYTQKDNREIERLIDLIQDEQQFNHERINELIEQNKKDKEERDIFIKNLADEHEKRIKEITDQSNKNIDDISNKYNEQLKQKDEEIDSLRAKITEIDADAERKLIEKQKEYETMIDDLKKEYEENNYSQQEELDKKIEEINKAKEEEISKIKEDYSKNHDEIKQKIDILQREKEDLERDNDNLKNQVDDLKENNEKIAKDNEDLQSEIENIQVEKENMINKMNSKIEESEKTIEELEKTHIDEINKKDLKYKELNEELNKVKSVNDELIEENEAIRQEQEVEKMKYEELLHELEEDKAELEAQKEAYNQLQMSRKNAIDAVNNALDDKELEEAEKNLATIDESIDVQSEMISKLNENINKYEDELSKREIEDGHKEEKNENGTIINNYNIQNIQNNIETTIETNVNANININTEEKETEKEAYEVEDYEVTTEEYKNTNGGKIPQLDDSTTIYVEPQKELDSKSVVDRKVEEKDEMDLSILGDDNTVVPEVSNSQTNRIVDENGEIVKREEKQEVKSSNNAHKKTNKNVIEGQVTMYEHEKNMEVERLKNAEQIDMYEHLENLMKETERKIMELTELMKTKGTSEELLNDITEQLNKLRALREAKGGN